MAVRINERRLKDVLDKHKIENSDKLAAALTEILSENIPSAKDISNDIADEIERGRRGLPS